MCVAVTAAWVPPVTLIVVVARPTHPRATGVSTVEPLATRMIGCGDTAETIADAYGDTARVSDQPVPGGAVHPLPADLRDALADNAVALAAWRDITRLARNEFICWVEDAKQAKTRERRIRRTQEELEEGKRRPCCWPGCAHRERTGR